MFCAIRTNFLGPVGIIQQQSSEEAISEAGRLGTKAERIRGEAYKKAQASGDRKLLRENELYELARRVAARFVGANLVDDHLGRRAGGRDGKRSITLVGRGRRRVADPHPGRARARSGQR